MTGFALPTAYSEQTTESISKDNSREGVLVSVAIAVINTMTISRMEKEAYFSLVIASTSPRGVRIGTQAGQEPGGRNAEVMWEHCLLACFL